MKTGSILLTLFAAILLGLLAWRWFLPGAPQRSPEITLTTIDGERLPLADLRGRPLLLTFWATTCPACLKEMPHLIELYDELSPQGLEIIGVAMRHDMPSHVLSMSRARDIPYPVALDLDGAVAQAFGNVRLTPTSFLIDPDGRIVMHKTGRMDMARLRRDILAMLNQSRPGHPPAAGESHAGTEAPLTGLVPPEPAAPATGRAPPGQIFLHCRRLCDNLASSPATG